MANSAYVTVFDQRVWDSIGVGSDRYPHYDDIIVIVVVSGGVVIFMHGMVG
jgi:hypothetical protein